MAKTKQVGVRFDEDLLKTVKEANLATSPQKALNLYERSYLELVELKVKINNETKNKERILAERNPPVEAGKEENTVVITLEKLREMCPKELTGIDRTMWIQEKRKLYGV